MTNLEQKYEEFTEIKEKLYEIGRHLRRHKITCEILEENKAQDEQWGEQNHDVFKWLSIITEELGELATEVNRHGFGGVKDENLRYEAVQVAACCVAMIECIDRLGYLD